jgi:hypothetical protein
MSLPQNRQQNKRKIFLIYNWHVKVNCTGDSNIPLPIIVSYTELGYKDFFFNLKFYFKFFFVYNYSSISVSGTPTEPGMTKPERPSQE